jgi:hypothetical protein
LSLEDAHDWTTLGVGNPWRTQGNRIKISPST